LNHTGRGEAVRRVAAFSDVHGNVEALDAVLADIERRGIAELWCLGDVVGNGHDPIGCLDRVEAACRVVLAGNHEVAIATRTELPPGARYSREALIRSGRLRDLAARPSEWSEDGVRLAHGCPSPFDPVRDYLVEDVAPEDVLGACSDARVVLVGHTHVAGVWRDGDRWLVDVGSVGEPRDRDTRATWVEVRWAGEAVTDVLHHRVEFDVRRYLANMRRAGLEVGPMYRSSASPPTDPGADRRAP
jgi:predicted phosphodiesterase